MKAESGEDAAVDTGENERRAVAGDYVYIGSDEVHDLENTGDEPVGFICIVPMRGEPAGSAG